MIGFREWEDEDTVTLYQWVTEEPSLWRHVGVTAENQTFAGLQGIVNLLKTSPAAEIRAVEVDGEFGGMVAAAPIYENGLAEPHIILSKTKRGKGVEVAEAALSLLRENGIVALLARPISAAHQRWLIKQGYEAPYLVKDLTDVTRTRNSASS